MHSPATFVIFITITNLWVNKKVSLSVVWLLHTWHSVWGDVECLSACWHFLHSPRITHLTFQLFLSLLLVSFAVYFYPVVMVAMVIIVHCHDNQSDPDHWPWHHTPIITINVHPTPLPKMERFLNFILVRDVAQSYQGNLQICYFAHIFHRYIFRNKIIY